MSQTESPVAKASSPNPNAGSSTSNINGDMYIADGDYIKDIEVNDLRNRYTLTKGSTQKMVIILVISTDNPRCPTSKSHVILMRFYIAFYILPFVETARSLQWADLAHCNPSLASADLHCVKYRLKRRLAPVRYTSQS